MTFASIEFLILFLVVLALLLVVQRILPIKEKARQQLGHFILLVASYIFYGWWAARFCTLLLGVTFIAFFSAKKKDVTHLGLSRIYLLIGVGTPLAVLALFKYFDFFVDSFCNLFQIEASPALGLILPVGISFYTFQALSYTIDVYNGRIEKEKSLIHFALYIGFFPQLVAGPIVKASEFLPQLMERRFVTGKRLAEGIQIFVFGMFKKVVLADNLSVYVDEVFRTPSVFGSGTVLLAVVSYAIQIYMDFSGYSDMAIGCAKCLGYDLNKNFNLPYLSQNVSEFWKRWHISLSTWLQQYLYIPLGGNRKGEVRTYVNLMLTMLLGGLWHGADWTFVLWGGLHGAALCVHKFYLKKFHKDKTGSVHGVVRFANIVLTDIFVCFCWIFFRAGSMEEAGLVLRQLFSFRTGVTHIYSWSIVALILVIVATFAAMIRHRSIQKEQSDKNRTAAGFWIDGYYPVLNLNRFWSLVAFFVEIGLILGLAYVQGSPFIYFQF